MRFARSLSIGAAMAVLASVIVFAHPRTTKGTVVAAEPTKITISTIDDTTKKPVEKAFEIDKETKIYRGETVVTFAAAKIQKGENVSITVDLDVADDLADVVRLPAAR